MRESGRQVSELARERAQEVVDAMAPVDGPPVSVTSMVAVGWEMGRAHGRGEGMAQAVEAFARERERLAARLDGLAADAAVRLHYPIIRGRHEGLTLAAKIVRGEK